MANRLMRNRDQTHCEQSQGRNCRQIVFGLSLSHLAVALLSIIFPKRMAWTPHQLELIGGTFIPFEVVVFSHIRGRLASGCGTCAR